MIFTACPYCDAPQSFGYETGDPTGYFPSKCGHCGNVMWVHATSIGGQTRTHESFKAEIMHPGDEAEIDAAANAAEDYNCIEDT